MARLSGGFALSAPNSLVGRTSRRPLVFIFRLLPALVGLLALAQACLPGPRLVVGPAGTIVAKVLDKSNAPFAGVFVNLQKPTGSPLVGLKTTDQSGLAV